MRERWLLLSVKEEDFVGSVKGLHVYTESVINVLLYRFRSHLLLCVRNGQSRPNAASRVRCDSPSRRVVRS